jgi:hypothetical protein
MEKSRSKSSPASKSGKGLSRHIILELISSLRGDMRGTDPQRRERERGREREAKRRIKNNKERKEREYYDLYLLVQRNLSEIEEKHRRGTTRSRKEFLYKLALLFLEKKL